MMKVISIGLLVNFQRLDMCRPGLCSSNWISNETALRIILRNAKGPIL